MEGNEGTFCITLNHRKLAGLDKLLLGSPINIVIPASPEFYLQFMIIDQHHYPHFRCERNLKNATFSNAVAESLYQAAVLCRSKGC